MPILYALNLHKLLSFMNLSIIFCFLLSGLGCNTNQYYSQAEMVREGARGIRFSQDETWQIFLKTTYFYPVRDWFDGEWQMDRLCGKSLPAKNINEDGGVNDSSFYTNRNLEEMGLAEIARGGNRGPEPAGPFAIVKIKESGGSEGFIGTDAHGHKYLIKLDDREYPGLGSGAEIIASRIYWALGYNVPETYLITVTGTGNENFDGRRGIASRYVPGKVLGIYKYDWVKDRREYRGMKLAAAWLNDVDRSDNNNLGAASEEMIRFYILDFNGALGSWQGRPKKAWQGCRYRWDVERQMRGAVSLGLGREEECGGGYDYENHKYIFDSCLGFNPARWRAEKPNSAFDRMDAEDGRWMAGKIAQFSREQLQAIVNEADMGVEDSGNLLGILWARREAILEQ